MTDQDANPIDFKKSTQIQEEDRLRLLYMSEKRQRAAAEAELTEIQADRLNATIAMKYGFDPRDSLNVSTGAITRASKLAAVPPGPQEAPVPPPGQKVG